MTIISTNHFSEEEFKKWMEELDNQIPRLIWSHIASINGTWADYEPEEKYIPFEQDEYGVYGYKTLIKIPESRWFWSPNRFYSSEWVDNHLTAHQSPEDSRGYGIYATKDLESLKEWYEGYENMMGGLVYNFSAVRCYAVKIRVWGVVVEHTKGFRCEHAEIIEVLHGYR